MLFPWIVTFIGSLLVLIKASDYFTDTSEKIGLAFRLPPFIIGVTIVSIGTSLPELASSLVAVFHGETALVAANAVGSNIANIFLITGFSAILAGTLAVKRSLIDIDLPLLALATALALYVGWDGLITRAEGLIALIGYVIYAAYTLSTRVGDTKDSEVRAEIKKDIDEIPLKDTKKKTKKPTTKKVSGKVLLVFVLSIVGVWVGAEGTVRSIVTIAELLQLNVSVLVMSVLAFGTSLPEIVVSLQVVRKKKYEMALGNIFGSNVFNILVVTGIPALFAPLVVDDTTLGVGFAFLIGATVLYIISGISKNIHNWEGAMYLVLYGLFLVKVFGLF